MSGTVCRHKYTNSWHSWHASVVVNCANKKARAAIATAPSGAVYCVWVPCWNYMPKTRLNRALLSSISAPHTHTKQKGVKIYIAYKTHKENIKCKWIWSSVINFTGLCSNGGYIKPMPRKRNGISGRNHVKCCFVHICGCGKRCGGWAI